MFKSNALILRVQYNDSSKLRELYNFPHSPISEHFHVLKHGFHLKTNWVPLAVIPILNLSLGEPLIICFYRFAFSGQFA